MLCAFMLRKGQIITTSGKNSVVLIKIADELEVFSEAGIMQHAPGIATNGEYTPDFDVMVAVQNKAMRVIGYRAAINYRLAVILAGWLQTI